MKPTSDTEMDRLLRRHARRKTVARDVGESAFAREDAPLTDETSAHLDADELSAFAENALPPAARARYISHLADCDTCRSIAARLALAAHTEVEEKGSVKASEIAPARSWRDWLSAFFAPSVLRYAVPAIVLFAVTVIAFIALRDRNKTSDVAQNEPQQKAQTNAAAPSNQEQQTKNIDSVAQSNSAPAPFSNTNAQSNAKVGSNTAGESQDRETQAKAGDTVSASEDQPSPPPPVAVAQREERKRDGEDVARVNAAPTPSDATGLAGSVADNRVADNKDEASRTQAAKEKRAEAPATTTATAGAPADKFGAMESNNGPALASKSASQSGARGRSSRRTDATPKAEQQRAATEGDDATETRRVGGRQFRRQGGVWVDTAYNSSRQATSVARGSEQYRALVADEPGIRAIAEQLGGEVIIVWKGRAYRIH